MAAWLQRGLRVRLSADRSTASRCRYQNGTLIPMARSIESDGRLGYPLVPNLPVDIVERSEEAARDDIEQRNRDDAGRDRCQGHVTHPVVK